MGSYFKLSSEWPMFRMSEVLRPFEEVLRLKMSRVLAMVSAT